MRLQLLGNFNKEDAYEKAMQEPQKYIDFFMSDELDCYDPNVLAIYKDDKDLIQKGNFLHIDEDAMEKYLFFQESSGFTLYRILPNVEDNNIFHWKERWGNKKSPYSRSIWCRIENDLLKFCITYHLYDGSARISVWVKDGTITYINISNATNEKITKAINDYISDIKAKAEKMQLF